MSNRLRFLRCDLKNARNLIAENLRYQIENSKKYINRFISWRKPKFEINNNLFIKSLMLNSDISKENFLFEKNNESKKNLKKKAVQINKKKNIIKSNFPELRKSQSCVDIYEEKHSLINNNIKPNNKFKYNFYDDIVKNQDMDISPTFKYIKQKENNNDNLIKSFRIISQSRNNHSLKNYKNDRLFNNFSNRIFINKRPKSNQIMKVNQGSQSSIDIDTRKYKSNNSNKKIKQKLSSKKYYYFKKLEYLKFLEKKSLSLRANFIVNNIQDNRGGKQELRASYYPFDK